MTDIATLGLQVDSSPVDKANSSLDAFAKTAGTASQKSNDLVAVTKQMASALDTTAAAHQRTNAILTQQGALLDQIQQNTSSSVGSWATLAAGAGAAAAAYTGMNTALTLMKKGMDEQTAAAKSMGDAVASFVSGGYYEKISAGAQAAGAAIHSIGLSAQVSDAAVRNFQQTTQKLGLDTGEVTTILAKMQDNFTSNSAAAQKARDTLAQYGVTSTDASTALQQFLGKLSQYDNDSNRLQAQIAVTGSSNIKLIGDLAGQLDTLNAKQREANRLQADFDTRQRQVANGPGEPSLLSHLVPSFVDRATSYLGNTFGGSSSSLLGARQSRITQQAKDDNPFLQSLLPDFLVGPVLAPGQTARNVGSYLTNGSISGPDLPSPAALPKAPVSQDEYGAAQSFLTGLNPQSAQISGLDAMSTKLQQANQYLKDGAITWQQWSDAVASINKQMDALRDPLAKYLGDLDKVTQRNAANAPGPARAQADFLANARAVNGNVDLTADQTAAATKTFNSQSAQAVSDQDVQLARQLTAAKNDLAAAQQNDDDATMHATAMNKALAASYEATGGSVDVAKRAAQEYDLAKTQQDIADQKALNTLTNQQSKLEELIDAYLKGTAAVKAYNAAQAQGDPTAQTKAINDVLTQAKGQTANLERERQEVANGPAFLSAVRQGPAAAQQYTADRTNTNIQQSLTNAAAATGDPATIQRVQQMVEEFQQLNKALQDINQQAAGIKLDQDFAQTVSDNAKLIDALQQGTKEYQQQAAEIQIVNQYKAAGITISEKEATDRAKIVGTQQDEINKLNTGYADMKRVSDDAAKSLIDGLENAALSGGKLTDVLKSIGTELTKIAFDVSIGGPLRTALSNLTNGSGGSSGGGGGILGFIQGLFSSGGGATAADAVGGTSAFASAAPDVALGLFANGAAFSRGRLMPFAAGDVFNSPTYFPMAGGDTGMLGESGPEAIMPLSRDSSGKLGVKGGGAGGSSGDTHYHIDARGASPGVEKQIEQVLMRHIPGIVRQSTTGAITHLATQVSRGGVLAKTMGRRPMTQ